MKAIVLGYGKSGKSASDLLLKKGYEVIAVDKKKVFDDTSDRFLSVFQEDEIKDISRDVDFIVLSSGIKCSHRICKLAKKKKIPIISEIDLAFRYIKNRCVGITGTNGKTFVVSLIEFVLNKNNIKAKAVGNIGKSLSSYALEFFDENDILIMELSSFQLDFLKSKILDIALIINICEDHIDWHGSMENYIKAKFNISKCLKNKKNKNCFFYISKEIKEKKIFLRSLKEKKFKFLIM